VEFVGLPGVGKSHVNRLVAARLAGSGTPVRSTYLSINHELDPRRRVIHKAAICLAELARRPGDALRLGRVVGRSGQKSRVDVARMFYNWLTVRGLVRRARSRPGVELLDEGTFQILWSLGLGGRDRAARRCASILADRPMPDTSLPDVVVLVEAPLEVIIERIALRASRDARIDRMDKAERRAALLRGADLLAEVLSDEVGLIGRFSVPLRRVRNGDPEDLDADLDALVRELASRVA
jgi:hypothetical protein